MYNDKSYDKFKKTIRDYTLNIDKQYDGTLHSTLLNTVYNTNPFVFNENPFIDTAYNIYQIYAFGKNGELFFTITNGKDTYIVKIFDMDNLTQSGAFANEIFNNMYFNRDSEIKQYIGRFLPTMKYAKVFKSNKYIKANYISNIDNIGIIAYLQFKQLFNDKEGRIVKNVPNIDDNMFFDLLIGLMMIKLKYNYNLENVNAIDLAMLYSSNAVININFVKNSLLFGNATMQCILLNFDMKHNYGTIKFDISQQTDLTFIPFLGMCSSIQTNGYNNNAILLSILNPLSSNALKALCKDYRYNKKCKNEICGINNEFRILLYDLHANQIITFCNILHMLQSKLSSMSEAHVATQIIYNYNFLELYNAFVKNIFGLYKEFTIESNIDLFKNKIILTSDTKKWAYFNEFINNSQNYTDALEILTNTKALKEYTAIDFLNKMCLIGKDYITLVANLLYIQNVVGSSVVHNAIQIIDHLKNLSKLPDFPKEAKYKKLLTFYPHKPISQVSSNIDIKDLTLRTASFDAYGKEMDLPFDMDKKSKKLDQIQRLHTYSNRNYNTPVRTTLNTLQISRITQSNSEDNIIKRVIIERIKWYWTKTGYKLMTGIMESNIITMVVNKYTSQLSSTLHKLYKNFSSINEKKRFVTAYMNASYEFKKECIIKNNTTITDKNIDHVFKYALGAITKGNIRTKLEFIFASSKMLASEIIITLFDYIESNNIALFMNGCKTYHLDDSYLINRHKMLKSKLIEDGFDPFFSKIIQIFEIIDTNPIGDQKYNELLMNFNMSDKHDLFIDMYNDYLSKQFKKSEISFVLKIFNLINVNIILQPLIDPFDYDKSIFGKNNSTYIDTVQQIISKNTHDLAHETIVDYNLILLKLLKLFSNSTILIYEKFAENVAIFKKLNGDKKLFDQIKTVYGDIQKHLDSRGLSGYLEYKKKLVSQPFLIYMIYANFQFGNLMNERLTIIKDWEKIPDAPSYTSIETNILSPKLDNYEFYIPVKEDKMKWMMRGIDTYRSKTIYTDADRLEHPEESGFMELVYKYGLTAMTGISGHASLIYFATRILKLHETKNKENDLRIIALACIAYMVPRKDHSIDEIIEAARFFGIECNSQDMSRSKCLETMFPETYEFDKTIVTRNEFMNKVNLSMGMPVDIFFTDDYIQIVRNIYNILITKPDSGLLTIHDVMIKLLEQRERLGLIRDNNTHEIIGIKNKIDSGELDKEMYIIFALLRRESYNINKIDIDVLKESISYDIDMSKFGKFYNTPSSFHTDYFVYKFEDEAKTPLFDLMYDLPLVGSFSGNCLYFMKYFFCKWQHKNKNQLDFAPEDKNRTKMCNISNNL